jgi:thiol:disulfide interchange protein
MRRLVRRSAATARLEFSSVHGKWSGARIGGMPLHTDHESRCRGVRKLRLSTMMRTTANAMAALAVMAALAGCETSTAPPSSSQSSAPAPARPTLARGRIVFVDGYRQGIELARQQRKPALVFFTASWCEYCHQMADEAFTQDQVVGLSNRFQCILVDADAEREVCREFGVRGYPTIQFLSPDGIALNRVTGKRPANQLVIEMQAALQAVARRTSGAGSMLR